MGLSIGALALDNAMLGTSQIDAIMLGAAEVWSAFKIPSYTGSFAVFGDKKKGRIELYSSGILTLSKGAYDIFMVGGGGAGGQAAYAENTSYASSGGGSGYTKTIYQSNRQRPLDIYVGGGALGIERKTGSHGGAYGGNGGTTYIVENGYRMFEVAGGEGGKGAREKTTGDRDMGPYICTTAANGGSGSGKGGSGSHLRLYCGAGGSDGSDGMEAKWSNSKYPGGKGQGSTTRAFGEAGGTLYAGGGGGGAAGKSNTGGLGGGGGGGTGSYNTSSQPDATGGVANTGGGGGGSGENGASGGGGSGLVIVRWGY